MTVAILLGCTVGQRVQKILKSTITLHIYFLKDLKHTLQRLQNIFLFCGQYVLPRNSNKHMEECSGREESPVEPSVKEEDIDVLDVGEEHVPLSGAGVVINEKNPFVAGWAFEANPIQPVGLF